MPELTDEKLAKLKKNAFGLMSQARQELWTKYPFIGNIALKLDLVPVRDIRCRTACTDGSSIYFDIAFMSDLSFDEIVFVIGHEVWHNAMLHFVRKQNRDKDLFNIAADFEVNQLLEKDGLKPPADVCFPQKFGFPKDLSAEDYYELLLEQQKNGNSGIPYLDENSSTSGNGKKSKSKVSGQFDKHCYSNDEEANDSNPLTDKYGEVGFDRDFNPCISNDTAERVKGAIVASSQMYERTRGKLPAHISQLVNKITKPEIRWQEVLSQFVTRCYGDKREWYPPNRRHIWHDAYFQSRRSNKIKLAVGIDTSGSTTLDIPKFLGELNGIVNSFGNYELYVIQCDTDVSAYDVYTDDNPLDLEHTKFEVKGGGGTTLHPIFDYIRDNAIEADAYLIFTDGFIDTFNESDDPGKPVLWILTSDGSKHQIHFGEILRFKEKSF